MLQGEYSAILSTFIKLPIVIKISVLSIFELPFYTGFTVKPVFKSTNPRNASHVNQSALKSIRYISAYMHESRKFHQCGSIDFLGVRCRTPPHRLDPPMTLNSVHNIATGI